MKMAEIGALSSCLGDGFVKGAAGFLSRDDDDDDDGIPRKKSILRKMLPWIVAAGGGALALKYGDLWGRHAAAAGIDDGPVKGTLKAIAEAATGHKFRYRGNEKRPPRDFYHSPMSNKEYSNYVVYGTTGDPGMYDSLGETPPVLK